MLIKLRKILLFKGKNAMNIPATKMNCYLNWMSLPDSPDTFPSALCTALHSLHCPLRPLCPFNTQFSSVTQSCLTLRPHGLHHARLPCPSPIPGVYSNLCPLSRWCHPTISSSVIPFSSWLQSFPASGSFPVSQFFASGAQSIGASASASVLPMNIQDLFSVGLIGFDLLAVQGILKSLLQHHSSKTSFL